MTFVAALTATEYTRLHGVGNVNPHYAGGQYLSLCPNTNILATTVSAIPSTQGMAQVTCTAAPAAVTVGQTVLISKTNDRRAAFFRGRVRKTPAGNVLYIDWTGADIEVNDYLWVLDDFDTHIKKPRDTGVGGAYYKDYDEAYHVPRPIITGLKSAYADFVGAGDIVTLSFAPGYILANPSATTISTWAWDVEDGTITVGNAATQNITATFPIGFRWVHLSATDDAGQTNVFHFMVHAHDRSTYPPELDFSGAQITASVDGGYTATVRAFDGVATVLDRTAACIWSQEWYNAALTELYARIAQVEFVGRLRTERDSAETDPQASLLTEVAYTIEGPGEQLARLNMDSLPLRFDAAPSVWDELDDLTPWRAMIYILDVHSTYCTVHSLEFDSTANTYVHQLLGVIEGTLLDSVNHMARRINKAIEFAPDGRSKVLYNARYLDTAPRAALTTVGAFAPIDFIDMGLDYDPLDTIGQTDVIGGGTYDTVNDVVNAFLSRAPGVRDENAATVSMPGQVLSADLSDANARIELNFRVGQHLAASQPQYTLQITFAGSYHAALVPSRGCFYSWAIDATEIQTGREFTASDKWLLVNMEHSQDNAAGTRSLNAVFEHIPLTPAPSGITITYPVIEEIQTATNYVPTISPFPSFKESPDIILPTGAVYPDDYPPGYDEWESEVAPSVLGTWLNGNGLPPGLVRLFGCLLATGIFYSNNCTCTYNGTYDRIEGCCNAAGVNYGAVVKMNLSSLSDITKIEIKVAWNKTRMGPDPDDVANIRLDGVNLANATNNVMGAGSTTLTWNGSTTGSVLLLGGESRNWTPGDGAYWRMTEITIEGTV